MKIKDLFKMMEKANQFAKMVGEEPYQMCVSLDGYYGMKLRVKVMTLNLMKAKMI